MVWLIIVMIVSEEEVGTWAPIFKFVPEPFCSDRELLGSPYSQHGTQRQARGGPQYLETFRAGADPGSILSWKVYVETHQLVLYYLLSWSVYYKTQLVGWAAMDSGRRITGRHFGAR